LFGSILLPALLVLTHSPFLIGWAKPVPYNPNNLRNKKWGEIAVAGAGVLANLFLAVFFGLILRFSLGANVPAGLPTILSSIVVVNLGLAIFNLVPIPPLDGSKILFNLLPASFRSVIMIFERYSLIFIVLFIVFLSSYLVPILLFLFKLITGISF
jgi:Zn-dependent protease